MPAPTASWSVTDSEITNTFTFTKTAPVGTVYFRFSINIQPAEAMGFIPNTTYAFTAGVLTSVNSLQLQTKSVFYLSCNQVENSIFQEIFAAGVGTFGDITFLNPDPILTRKKITHPQSYYWRFAVLDEDGSILKSLHGQHVEFSIVLMRIASAPVYPPIIPPQGPQGIPAVIGQQNEDDEDDEDDEQDEEGEELDDEDEQELIENIRQQQQVEGEIEGEEPLEEEAVEMLGSGL